MVDHRALTSDGYLKDQDYLANYQYGYWPTSFNGCGWVAAFNLIHTMRSEVTPDEVHRAMLEFLTFNGRRGTPFPDLAAFFTQWAKMPFWRVYGKSQILERLSRRGVLKRGVLRYVEGDTPHYIAFYEVNPEKLPAEVILPDPLVPGEGPFYRFFNAADGLEDFAANMKNFRRDHISHDLLIRLLIPKEKDCPGLKALEIRGNGAMKQHL